jgi:hypothetical protein
LKYRKGLLMTGTYPKPEVAPNDWSDGVDDARTGINSRKGCANMMVVVMQRIFRSVVRGKDYHRLFICHHRWP